MNRSAPHLVLIFALIAVDQATKFAIARTIAAYQTVTVIPRFFSLSRVHNRGAIFGMFSQAGGTVISRVLLVASLLALGMVVYYFLRTPAGHKTMKTALALILAGALGNLIDRVVRGYVIDFLEVRVRHFVWPTFNVADSCITIGAILLVAVLILRRA